MIAYQSLTGHRLTIALYDAEIQYLRGIQVSVGGEKAPTRIFEALSGKELRAEKVNERYQCTVPDFSLLALVVIEY